MFPSDFSLKNSFFPLLQLPPFSLTVSMYHGHTRVQKIFGPDWVVIVVTT